jgi:hypothetical protein
MRTVGTAVVLAFFSVIVGAQTSVAVSPEVESVVTGGSWSSGVAQGTFRAVVTSDGFEHVVSQLQIDWISGPKSPNDESHVVSSKVVETGSWRLGTPRISKCARAWCVSIQGEEPHTTTRTRMQWVIELGEPGSLKVISRQ